MYAWRLTLSTVYTENSRHGRGRCKRARRDLCGSASLDARTLYDDASEIAAHEAHLHHPSPCKCASCAANSDASSYKVRARRLTRQNSTSRGALVCSALARAYYFPCSQDAPQQPPLKRQYELIADLDDDEVRTVRYLRRLTTRACRVHPWGESRDPPTQSHNLPFTGHSSVIVLRYKYILYTEKRWRT